MKPMRSVILEQAIAALCWLMLLAALWVLLRSQQQPRRLHRRHAGGGGKAAPTPWCSARAARRRLPLPPITLAGLGLGLATTSPACRGCLPARHS